MFCYVSLNEHADGAASEVRFIDFRELLSEGIVMMVDQRLNAVVVSSSQAENHVHEFAPQRWHCGGGRGRTSRLVTACQARCTAGCSWFMRLRKSASIEICRLFNVPFHATCQFSECRDRASRT